jgi:GMP synthase-like glutamine amidotransferase
MARNKSTETAARIDDATTLVSDSIPSAYERNHQELLANIKSHLSDLEECFSQAHFYDFEDCVYRFYHKSNKVYGLQWHTDVMVTLLQKLAPGGTSLNDVHFLEIIKDGTGKEWEIKHNGKAWTKHTRPIIEAFVHANFMISMAIKYGNMFNEAPRSLPSGWAALLCLYGIR